MVNWTGEDVPSTGMLHTVAAAEHSAAWAFGISVREEGRFATLVFHRGDWGWEQVAAPQIGRVNRAIAISDVDVWAVGDGTSLHWDGTRWRQVPTAVLEDSEAQFFGLAHFSGADVWTAGYAPGRNFSGGRGIVQRWDGAAWTDLDNRHFARLRLGIQP